MWRYLILLLFLVTTNVSVVSAKEAPPKVFVTVIRGMIDADGSGTYLSMLRSAWRDTDIDVEILPAKRALDSFSRALNGTCFMPLSRKFSEQLGINSHGKIFSKPFNTSFSTLISNHRTIPPKSLNDIKGRVIGVLRGFPIAEEIEIASSKLQRTASIESLLKMLEVGRIDLAYISYPDVALAYSELGLSRFPESEMKFQLASESLACTDDLADSVGQFNRAIDNMYKDGTIKNVLGDAYIGRDVSNTSNNYPLLGSR